MDKDNSLQKDIFYFRNQALSMMDIYKPLENIQFVEWLNRFDYVKDKIKVPSDIIRELFRTMIDNRIHDYVRKDLFDDEKNDLEIDLPYNSLWLTYLGSLHKEAEYVYNYRFKNRKQFEDETIEEYADNLEKMFYKCHDISNNNEILKEHFCNGIFNDNIKSNLENNSSLLFEEIKEKAIELEKLYDVNKLVETALSEMDILQVSKLPKFHEWINDFEYFADKLKVPENKMVEFFYKMIDNKIHTYVRGSLSSVNLPQPVNYEDVRKLYINKIYSSNEVLFNRNRLQHRKQYILEPLIKYLNSMKKIYDECSYAANDTLYEAIYSGLHLHEIKNEVRNIEEQNFSTFALKACEIEKKEMLCRVVTLASSKMDRFELDTGKNFLSWLNKFEDIAEMIKVPDNLMVEFFENMINKATHQIVQKECSIENLSNHSYKEVVCFYVRHFSRDKEDLYIERFRYRFQYPKETIKKYATELKKLFRKCKFENRLKASLVKRFIDGIYDREIKMYLKTFSNLTFEEALEKALNPLRNTLRDYLKQALLMIHTCESESKDDFFTWLNRFEYVVDKIKVPEDIMIDFVNNMIDTELYMRVKNKYHSEDFSELPYQEIITNYIKYFSYENEKNFFRSRFINRTQFEDETIDEYANILNKIYEKCAYKSGNINKLREQFIDGIFNEEVKKLLTEYSSLPMDELLAKALELEKSNKVTHYLNKALTMIPIFDPKKEGLFYEWLNKFEFVTDLIKVPDELMVEFFDKMIDSNIHILINRQVPSTFKFSEHPYDTVISYYVSFFSLPQENLNEKRFMCRERYEGETLSNYADRLQKIYNKCSFRKSYKKTLHDKFLSAVDNDEMKRDIEGLRNFPFAETIAYVTESERKENLPFYVNQVRSRLLTDVPKFPVLFIKWLNYFESYANNLKFPDELMVEIFHKTLDKDIHTNVKENFSILNFSKLSYKEIIDCYLRYFSPYEVDLHVNRFKYRHQFKDETIEVYANNLRKILSKCSYANRHDKNLNRYLINGIVGDGIQNYFQKFLNLTIEEVLEKATAILKNDELNPYLNKAFPMIHIFSFENEDPFFKWYSRFVHVIKRIIVPVNLVIPFFNAMIDTKVHMHVKNKYHSVDFSQLPFDDIIINYINYFSNENFINFTKDRFINRTQFEDETIEAYAYILKKTFVPLSIVEGFQENTLLQQFVNGILNDELKQYVIENSSLPIDELFAKTIEYDKSRRIIPYLNKAQRIMNIFKAETGDIFCMWLNKFEAVVDILELPDDLKLDFYNAMIDKETFTRINSMQHNINYSVLSYEETVNNHLYCFDPLESDCHLKRFTNRKQFENEKVEKYVYHLKQIKSKCNPTSVDDTIFKVRFYKGLQNQNWRQPLEEIINKPIDEFIDAAIRLEYEYESKTYIAQAHMKMNKFNQESNNKFYDWLNRFEYVADSLGIPDDKMTKIFINFIQDNVQNYINNAYSDITHDVIPYELLINKYLDYFYVVDKNNTNRIRFMNRMQYVQEIIEKYANNLRKIFDMCNYRSGHERRLIQQFLHGIRDDELKKYLRDNPSSSYNETVKNAIEFETRNYIKKYKNQSSVHIYNTDNGEEFCIWFNKFEYVADLLEVPDFHMVHLFNEMVDNNVHMIVKDADSYVNLSKLPYDEIVDHYLRCFYPNEVDVRLKCFMCRDQYEDESIAQYSHNLQRIFNKCFFSNRQNEYICRKFVSGLRDENVKSNLSEMHDLTYPQLVQKATEIMCSFDNIV